MYDLYIYITFLFELDIYLKSIGAHVDNFNMYF